MPSPLKDDYLATSKINLNLHAAARVQTCRQSWQWTLRFFTIIRQQGLFLKYQDCRINLSLCCICIWIVVSYIYVICRKLNIGNLRDINLPLPFNSLIGTMNDENSLRKHYCGLKCNLENSLSMRALNLDHERSDTSVLNVSGLNPFWPSFTHFFTILIDQNGWSQIIGAYKVCFLNTRISNSWR